MHNESIIYRRDFILYEGASSANKSVGDCGNRENEAGENLLHQNSRPQHGKTMTKENGKRNWLYRIQEVNFTRDETPKEIPGTLGKGLSDAHSA